MSTPRYAPGQERAPVNPPLDVPKEPRYIEGYWEQSIPFESRQQIQCMDITDLVRSLVRKLPVSEGTVDIWNLHTTSGLLVNEYEPYLMQDFLQRIADQFPKEDTFLHNNQPLSGCTRGNADAHLRTIASCTQHVSVPIIQGGLGLGPYQSIIFAEFDGPRLRTLYMRTHRAKP